MPNKTIAVSKNTPKRPRADGQLSGLAGELFVAAELLKRGLQTSITMGNAKRVDLLAYHPGTKKSFAIQVKALRSRNYFLLSHKSIEPSHVYAFVLLNMPGQAVRYFIVPGADLHSTPERFSKWFLDPKMPGVHPKLLTELGYEDAWDVFGPVSI